MKVIRVDNYDREGPGHDDVLITRSLTMSKARRMAIKLNGKFDRDDNAGRDVQYFYKAVPNTYKLKKFKP